LCFFIKFSKFLFCGSQISFRSLPLYDCEILPFFIGFLSFNALVTMCIYPSFEHLYLLPLQVRQIEPNIGQTENRTFQPLKNITTAAEAIGGRDLYEILPPEKVQKVWTCALCQVTAQSETVLNSHLQGKRHKAAREQLKVKSQTPKGEVSSASVGKKSNVTMATARIGVRDHTGILSPQNAQKVWTCLTCQVTLKSQTDINSHLQGKQHEQARALLNSKNQASHSNASSASVGKKTNFPENKPEKCTISNNTSPENRIHEAKKQGKQENPMKSLFVEIRNSKWRCTICNVSCTSEGDMACHLKGNKHLDVSISKWQCTICNVNCTSEGDIHCHLNGNKHLARMRELDGLGGSRHA
jgi:hypothetical protein